MPFQGEKAFRNRESAQPEVRKCFLKKADVFSDFCFLSQQRRGCYLGKSDRNRSVFEMFRY